jgi:hypothetical protein
MPEDDDEDKLRTALDQTFQMLRYASQKGIVLNDGDIASIIAANKSLRENNVTGEVEAAFWRASSSIAKSIAPVTLDSLDANRRSGNQSAASRAARRFRVRTTITLVALLVFQVYWLIGATLIGDLTTIQTRMSKLKEEEIALRQSANGSDPNRSSHISELPRNLAQIDSNLRAQQEERAEAEVNLIVLRNWNIPKVLLFWSQQPEFENVIVTKSGLSPNDVMEIQTAKIILTALIKYILPILYGALGASAYIVRVLSDEIRSVTYSEDTNIRYQLRFYLGAVAGLAIAWFTSESSDQQSIGILQSLSPLALAFLAGYSVDLLFSLLDRIVLAFSGPAPSGPAQQSTTVVAVPVQPAGPAPH